MTLASFYVLVSRVRELDGLRLLQHINIANNLLTEPLPYQLIFCDQLEDIDLHGNALTGALPEGIWRLTLLEYLTLNNNRCERVT